MLDVPIPVNRFVEMCNQIWVVTCRQDVRLQRLEDRGMDREEASRRIAMQMDDEEYQMLADHVIDNSGSIEDTTARIEELIESQLSARGIRI